MTYEQEAISSVLVALADPTRRQLLGVLAAEGQASATRLADLLPVSRQAVAKHLQLLERAGLVSAGRSGREVIYQVEPEPLEASARWLENLADSWDRRLEALKRVAERLEDDER